MRPVFGVHGEVPQRQVAGLAEVPSVVVQTGPAMQMQNKLQALPNAKKLGSLHVFVLVKSPLNCNCPFRVKKHPETRVEELAVVPLNPKLLAAASQDTLSPINFRPPTSTHLPVAGRG